MPTSEYTQTITVVHDFLPGQIITDGRYTFKVVRIDAEAEEYVVDDLDAEDGKGQGVDISYTDAKFGLKPRQVVFVCTYVDDYDGPSSPISLHRTLEGAQGAFGHLKTWAGPTTGQHREWSARLSRGEYAVIAEMELLP